MLGGIGFFAADGSFRQNVAAFDCREGNFPSKKKIEFFIFREESVSQKILQKNFFHFFTKPFSFPSDVSLTNFNDYQNQLQSLFLNPQIYQNLLFSQELFL